MFMVIWTIHRYEEPFYTYYKNFTDENEAKNYAEKLKNKNSRCTTVEVGVVRGDLWIWKGDVEDYTLCKNED